MKSAHLLLIMTTMLCSLPVFAAQATAPAKSQNVEELEKAKAKADRASAHDKCYDSVEVVRALVEVANDQFNAGDVEQAQQTVKEIVNYADQAREASQHSGHKLKQSEITLRKAQRRLDDIRRSLPFEDQATVEAALKQLEADRQEILHQVLLH